MITRCVRLGLATGLAAGLAPAALADALVLGAVGVPDIATKQPIAAGKVVDVPEGGSLRLLQADDQIIEAKGPLQVVVRATGTAAGVLYSALSAVRAFIPRGPMTAVLADPWVINLGSGGAKCYRGDAEVQVALDAGRPEGVYTLEAVADRRQVGHLRLAPNTPAQSWPASMVQFSPDATYRVTFPAGKPTALIRLRQVETAGREPKAVASGLLAAGCAEQAVVLLRALPPDERLGDKP